MPCVLIIGGSGFLGRHIAARLAAANLPLLIPTRRRSRAGHLLTLPQADIVEADVMDDGVLRGLVARSTHVINLIGVLHSPEGQPWGAAFQSAHVELPQRIVAACDAHGIERLIHVSALGAAADAPSGYLRSKAAGEAALRADKTPWTILQPSVVFGPEDSFLNLFASLLRVFPVLPLGGAEARLQPVYVGDVAQAVLDCLQHPESAGHSYELAGPQVFSLRELLRYVGEVSGCRRPVLALPDGLAALQAGVLECLPGPLMSRDNLRSLAAPSVASAAPLPFGRSPTPLQQIAPAYLSRQVPMFDRMRRRASRV